MLLHCSAGVHRGSSCNPTDVASLTAVLGDNETRSWAVLAGPVTFASRFISRYFMTKINWSDSLSTINLYDWTVFVNDLYRCSHKRRFIIIRRITSRVLVVIGLSGLSFSAFYVLSTIGSNIRSDQLKWLGSLQRRHCRIVFVMNPRKNNKVQPRLID